MRPELSLAECGYEEASQAARNARERRDRASYRRSGVSRARDDHRVEAAEKEQQNARDCEERLHDAADLEAQWAAATAAQNSSNIALSQWRWAYLEFAALVITIGAAIWAAWATQEANAQARKHFEEERRPWIKVSARVVGGWPPDRAVPMIERDNAIVEIEFTMENVGNSLAYNVLFNGPLVSGERQSIFDFQETLRAKIVSMRSASRPGNVLGTALFPNEPKVQRMIVALGKLEPAPELRRFPLFGGFASYRFRPGGPFHFTPTMLEFTWAAAPDTQRMPLEATQIADALFTDLAPD